MGLLISWLLLTVIIWLTAAIVPGVNVRGLGGAFIVAALFGVFNVLIGWLLFIVLGLGTLGLGFLLAFVTRWIVNAILLELVAGLTDRLMLATFGRAVLAAMVMSLLGTLADLMLGGLY